MKKRKSRRKQKLYLVLIALIVVIIIGLSNDNIRNYIEQVIKVDKKICHQDLMLEEK